MSEGFDPQTDALLVRVARTAIDMTIGQAAIAVCRRCAKGEALERDEHGYVMHRTVFGLKQFCSASHIWRINTDAIGPIAITRAVLDAKQAVAAQEPPQ